MAIEDLGNNGKCACFCGRLFSIAKSSVVAIEKRGVKPETKPLNPEQQILYRVVFISRPETWMKCIENLKFIDKHIKVSRDYTQQAIFAALNELESAQGFTLQNRTELASNTTPKKTIRGRIATQTYVKMIRELPV
jgi:hypothetical protein